MTEAPKEERERIVDLGIGLTLVGVMLNMGLTIGLTSSLPLRLRLPLAFVVPVVFFITLVWLGRRRKIISRLPWWLVRHGPDPWDALPTKRRDRQEQA